MSVMFINLQFYFRNYFFTCMDFSFDWLFFIKSIWWNQTKILIIKRWVSFCCCYGKKKKKDRNLKNILWTHAIRITTLPTPKFRPTPILWTHHTHHKISTLATHVFFFTHAKILWTHVTHAKISTHATHANFLTLAKILQTHDTHATKAKVWPMPPRNPRTHVTHATHTV